MELNKIVAGVCSTLLVFMGFGFFAEKVYHKDHGDHEELAFALEIDDASAGATEEEVVLDYAAIFAAADPVAGEKVFKKCASCHAIEAGANKTGPYLHGVVGRPMDAAEGFRYSGALPEGESWTGANLYHFLESPKKWAPGTSMGFNGLRKSADRANVIAYLNSLDGTPDPLGE